MIAPSGLPLDVDAVFWCGVRASTGSGLVSGTNDSTDGRNKIANEKCIASFADQPREREV